MVYLLLIALLIWYEWHQYQQRLSLRRQLDQRLSVLYAVEAAQGFVEQEASDNVAAEAEETAHEKKANERNEEFLDKTLNS